MRDTRYKKDRIKTILIITSSIAGILAVITYIVVFFGPSPIEPASYASGTDSFSDLPTSTPLGLGSSTFSTSTATTSPLTPYTPPSSSTTPGYFSTEFSAPYPVNWTAGREQFSVTGATLSQDQLTVILAVQMGNTSECVPMTLRLVSDEAGDLKAPDSPSGADFIFPDTQTCEGTPGATYSQSLIFTIDPAYSPFLFTTGGTSNIFFEAATTTDGGVSVSLPANFD